MTKITKIIFFDEKPEDLKQFVQSTFSKIHEELEEHLDAINENTNEIQANYEYLCELDKKIQHLQEEIKQLKNIISKITGQPIQSKPETNQIQPLTQEEQKVFLALYSESKPISYLELAQKLNLSLTLIRTYVTNLISKGIPVQKTYIKGRPLISLEPGFKELQAKENIVGLNQKLLGFNQKF